MKYWVVSIWILFSACSQSAQKSKDSKDTGLVYPTDSNLPSDTDDHNKNAVDSVPLDAPR